MPPFVIALILMAVSMLLTMLLAPKPQAVKPAALEDFDFPLEEDGTPQAVLFGDGWLGGPMICWYGNYRTLKIKASAK